MAVNCGAIPESLEESELFGHVQGAFTGATLRKLGRFEAADGGTILLDEISEASNSLQVKLLRILQSGEYTPVGTAENRYCDVRVVAATNRDLSQLVECGEFRRDLYYRLNVIRLELPPLRQRQGDIPLLAAFFLERFGHAYGKPNLTLEDEVADVLLAYDYPGNVRELENIIQRCVIVCRGDTVRRSDLPTEIVDKQGRRGTPIDSTFHEGKQRVVERFEREYLARALASAGGIIRRAADLAGLSERNFHAKLKKYAISGTGFRAPRAN